MNTCLNTNSTNAAVQIRWQQNGSIAIHYYTKFITIPNLKALITK